MISHIKGHPQLIALLLALLVYTCWSVSDALVKLATDEGAAPSIVLMFNGMFCSLFMASRAGIQKNFSALIPNSKRLVLYRTIATVISSFCFFTAFSKIPLANVYIIEFIAPFAIAIGAAIFLSERISLKQSLIIVTGFIGAYIATNPSNVLTNKAELIGCAFAIGGMLGFSTAQLFLRKLSQSEKPEAVLFTGSVSFIILGAILSLNNFTIPSLKAFVFIICSASFGLSGWFLTMAALKRAPAAIVSSASYWLLIPGTIFGYLIWHTIPEWNMFAGGAIIIASGLAMAHHTRKQQSVPA